MIGWSKGVTSPLGNVALCRPERLLVIVNPGSETSNIPLQLQAFTSLLNAQSHEGQGVSQFLLAASETIVMTA